MESLHTTATEALRSLLDQQPASPAKMSFVWAMAAGPAMARATRATWRDDGVLVVRAETDAWRRELRRARAVLSTRVRQLAGDKVVTRLVIE